MEVSNNKSTRSRAIKLGLGLLLISTFSFASYANCKEGLSAARQAEIINSIQDYEPMYSNQLALKTPDLSLKEKNRYCDMSHYSSDEYCHERRYMKDGRYRVIIVFSNNMEIPAQPSTPFILGSDPLIKDTAERDEFLEKWNDSMIAEYLGGDYASFHSAKLSGVSSSGVSIRLEIYHASELVNVLTEPRILQVYHIGARPSPLEEIAL